MKYFLIVFLQFTIQLYAHADIYKSDTGQVINLNPRNNVELNYLYLPHNNAVAHVILFVGGKGTLKFTEGWLRKRGKNFLLRSRELFRAQHFNVAVFNAPSDQRSSSGLKKGGRTSSEHIIDINALIDDLKSKKDLPVWLVGTSRGTESVAWAAIHSRDKISGVVLTASISEPNNNGISLPEMDLKKISAPVLLIAHQQDDCKVTPPTGAKLISAELANATKVILEYVSGGLPAKSSPCKALSAHGFYGIEKQVVTKITAFIKANIN